MTPRPPTNSRKERARFNRNLVFLVIVVLVVGGGALISLVYGVPAGALGLVCLLGGAGLIGLLWLLFSLIGRWVNPED